MEEALIILLENIDDLEKLRRLVRISRLTLLNKDSSKQNKNIAGCIFSWKVFASKEIPFELWDDIAKEGLELLTKLLEDPSIPYKELPGFHEFDNKVIQRVRELKFKHGYFERFTMDAYN